MLRWGEMSSHVLKYQVLGPLKVVRDDGVSPHMSRKQREFLAVLLVFCGEPCSRDMLVRTLWGDRPPANPAAAVHTCLCRVRQALGQPATASCLRTLDDGALLAAPRPQDLDLARFLQLYDAGMRQLGQGRLRPASETLEQALGCWRDPPLADLPDSPGSREVAARRDRLLQRRDAAWRVLADILLGLGQHDRILPELYERVVADPLREHSWAQLMLALHQGGRGGEALAAYSRARAELVRSLGTEPGPELQQLRDWVLAGPAAMIPAQWPGACVPARLPAARAG
jgi:DNA-binding SARP family transcriptional activator